MLLEMWNCGGQLSAKLFWQVVVNHVEVEPLKNCFIDASDTQ
jgi:hypothetical protein